MANILVIAVLASSTYAIYQVVERSKNFEKIKEGGGEVTWWDTNEVRPQVLTSRGTDKVNMAGTAVTFQSCCCLPL